MDIWHKNAGQVSHWRLFCPYHQKIVYRLEIKTFALFWKYSRDIHSKLASSWISSCVMHIFKYLRSTQLETWNQSKCKQERTKFKNQSCHHCNNICLLLGKWNVETASNMSTVLLSYASGLKAFKPNEKFMSFLSNILKIYRLICFVYFQQYVEQWL